MASHAETYASGKVARITTSASFCGMLQHWHERGVVIPDIVGHSRQYTADQTILLAFAMELRAAHRSSRRGPVFFGAKVRRSSNSRARMAEGILVISKTKTLLSGVERSPDIVRWIASQKNGCTVVPIPRASDVFRTGRRVPVVERRHYAQTGFSPVAALIGCRVTLR